MPGNYTPLLASFPALDSFHFCQVHVVLCVYKYVCSHVIALKSPAVIIKTSAWTQTLRPSTVSARSHDASIKLFLSSQFKEMTHGLIKQLVTASLNISSRSFGPRKRFFFFFFAAALQDRVVLEMVKSQC